MLSPTGDDRAISDLQRAWGDGERIFYRGWRDGACGPQAVLVVVPASNPPTADNLKHLSHEFELRHELADASWAARPLEMLREQGRTMLMLSDPGGEPLHRLLGSQIDLQSFLRVAISLCSAIGGLHDRGLVHKDIKPANIIIDCKAGRAWLTGFGIATRLSREPPPLEPPETIAGTLAYMAPEQTGRMNRSVDYRSDLYALGVTLYQLLTGDLPFAAADPMEWVHCHVARQAVPPAELVRGLPPVISAIVMKLLAKTAEERYQTAAGLESDFRRCLAEWKARRRIEGFALGQADTPDRLQIPEKLYGREHEIERMRASFDRVRKSGVPELVLVSGYSGVGKSAIVHELHKAVVPSGGLFASGKFDQHQRDIPYATLAQAFQSLIRGLLAKSDADLRPWRESLREALGPLGQLMVNLVPELKVVIGDQPPIADASPEDAQRRFHLVVRRFIGVFARPNHPLVLFVDDLQWLDVATLDLIETLLAQSDLRHLQLIGAYRHNEVDAEHPLMRKLEAIRKAGCGVEEISLAPLDRGAVEQLMLDTLRCELAHAAPLAELMHEKTGGNPFFLIQFLHALSEEELLTFDHDKAHWCWELGRIHAKGYTENVADLVIGKLSGLRDETQQVLLELACLGNSADATTLAVAHGTSEQRMHAVLREAIHIELVRLIDGSYAFVHDRVQEAVYGLQSDEGERAALHVRIGMALASHVAPDETSERVYLLANQLNRGVTALTSDAQRERAVAINLAAGRRARNATAYHAAIAYLEVARGLLEEGTHPNRSPTAFAASLLHAECEFLIGRLDLAEQKLLALSHIYSDLQSGADVTRLRAQLYTATGQTSRAIDVCIEFLRQVGIDWSPYPSRDQVNEARLHLRSLAKNLSDDELDALPPMTDPGHRATMAVLSDLIIPASYVDRDLSDAVLLAATRVTIEHGICPESSFALTTTFGVLASQSADAELGFRLSRFGAALADRQPQFGLSGRALLAFGLIVIPWVRPAGSGLPFVQRALEICLAVGDLSFAAYAHRGLLSVYLFGGNQLSEVCLHAEQALSFARASGQWLSVQTISVHRRLALGLAGRDEERSFDVAHTITPHPSQDTQPLIAFLAYASQIQLDVIAGRPDDALALTGLADGVSWHFRNYSEFTEYRFYTGLAHAAASHRSPPEGRGRHISGLREQLRKFTNWSARVPENFTARKTLLAAELSSIEGRVLEAEQLYEEAIRLARETGFVQIEAIAGERAAKFYEARGLRTIALSYLENARSCYLSWGADAKVRQLDEMYPHLRMKEPALNPASTMGASVEHLDLATVLKVSEAMSGEIVLEKLIGTLLRIALEHAGAERGLLILPRGSELRIRAEATAGASIRIDLQDSPVVGAEIPESLVLYAARTQESVILDDASVSEAFKDDEYVRRKKARSVLCLPLIKQGKPVALLYLENNLTPGAFTPARVAVLKFLASEAATSLDNARLYGELRKREARIRLLVDSNIIGIFIFDRVPDILDANQAFLKIVGYDREDIDTGRLRWSELTPPEWRERTARARAELGATGVVQPFEREFLRKDGSRVAVLTGGAAFNDEREEGVAFVLDLSERKRAEAAAHASEQRYREVQMELAHANRVAVMGQLTASIAHELNQPIGAAITYANAAASWLRACPPDLDEVRQALGFIVESNVRAGEVIDRARALVKKTPPRKSSLEVNREILEVAELMHGEMLRNRISVQTRLADDLPLVWADRVQFQQVMLNLLVNAIEAMKGACEAPRELQLGTEKLMSGEVLVMVRDSGPGFPPESEDRLFEAFYTTKPEGLGMGLSICHSIIEAHEGKLWASANVPRGAVFQFTLPAYSPGKVGG